MLITHTDTDPFNPDHPVAYEVVQRARSTAAGAGVASAFESITPPALFLFEPHQPELCNFMPTTFVDITPVIEAKREAMAAMEAQKYLQTYYDQRAEQRAHHARRASRAARRSATPRRSSACSRRWWRSCERELARLGVATVYEAAGREGLVDLDLHRIVPGSRAAGPARPVRCGQGDNLMVHAAMAHAQPGDVLVLTMPEPAPVALVGDLLATQAKARGVAALLVDGAVRDVEELAELGLPIWARWIRVRGADQGRAGHDRRAGRGRRRADRGRATSSCSTPTAPRSSRPSGSTRCSTPPGSARRASASSARSSQAGELSYDLDNLRARVRMSDLAHIHHVELLTPEPEREPGLLPRRARHGDRVARRPVGLPARLGRVPALRPQAHRVRPAPASPTWRCAPGAPRRSQRRVAAIEATGLGMGWIDGDHGHGPAYRFHDPDGHVFESLRDRALRAARAPAAGAAATSRSATRRAARRSSGSTTSTCSPTTSPPAARSPPTCSATATTRGSGSTTAGDRRLAEPHDRRPRADLRQGRARRRRPPAPPRVLGRHARGVPARGRHLPRHRRRTIEAAPSKHAVAPASSSTASSPAATAIEVTTGGYFVYEPDPEP